MRITRKKRMRTMDNKHNDNDKDDNDKNKNQKKMRKWDKDLG